MNLVFQQVHLVRHVIFEGRVRDAEYTVLQVGFAVQLRLFLVLYLGRALVGRREAQAQHPEGKHLAFSVASAWWHADLRQDVDGNQPSPSTLRREVFRDTGTCLGSHHRDRFPNQITLCLCLKMRPPTPTTT